MNIDELLEKKSELERIFNKLSVAEKADTRDYKITMTVNYGNWVKKRVAGIGSVGGDEEEEYQKASFPIGQEEIPDEICNGMFRALYGFYGKELFDINNQIREIRVKLEQKRFICTNPDCGKSFSSDPQRGQYSFCPFCATPIKRQEDNKQ